MTPKKKLINKITRFKHTKIKELNKKHGTKIFQTIKCRLKKFVKIKLLNVTTVCDINKVKQFTMILDNKEIGFKFGGIFQMVISTMQSPVRMKGPKLFKIKGMCETGNTMESESWNASSHLMELMVIWCPPE